MDIDWGQTRPSAADRAFVEASLSRATLDGATIGFVRRERSYVASLETARPRTSVRLHGSSLRGIAERAAYLLSIVSDHA